jgi:hypothetical protein
LTSTTVEPARLDMERWASGGIILSHPSRWTRLIHWRVLVVNKRAFGKFEDSF